MAAGILLISIVFLAADAQAQPTGLGTQATRPATTQATQAGEAPPPPAQSPPYTLAGVRRAAADAERPAEAPETDAGAPAPTRRLTRPAPRQQIDITAWAPGRTLTLPRSDELVTPSLAPAGPGWHQEFIHMATPDEYQRFGYMGNAERVEAMASAMAFGLAIEGATRLVKHLFKSYRDGTLEKLRREIDEETALVEKLYKEKKAADEKKAAEARKAGEPAAEARSTGTATAAAR